MRTVDPDKHRAKRRHIVHAAAGLFAARGYDGTTTAAICRAAGVSSGNLFHYFANKREIFAAIFSDGDDETSARLAAALVSEDPWAGLMDFVEHLAAPATEPVVPGLVLEAMLRAHRDPELAQMLGDTAADEEAGIAALLRRAADAGRIDPGVEPATAASWVMALIEALFLRAAVNDAFDAAEQMPTMRLVLERFLRPQR